MTESEIFFYIWIGSIILTFVGMAMLYIATSYKVSRADVAGVVLISAIPFVGTFLAIFAIINGLWEVLYKSNLDWWHHEE